jgi:hypothetical protein
VPSVVILRPLRHSRTRWFTGRFVFVVVGLPRRFVVHADIRSDEFCAKYDVPCLETAPTARLDVAAMSLSVPPSTLQKAIEAHDK